MSSNLVPQKFLTVVLLLLIVLEVGAKGPTMEQNAVPRPATLDGQPALSFSVCRSASSSVTLTTRNGEEAFRFPVMHIHNGKWKRHCRGYVYVTPTQVVYDPVAAQTESDKADAFQVAKSEVTVKVSAAWDEALQVQTLHRTYRFWLGVDGVGADDRIATCGRDAVWEWAERAFQGFASARAEFAALTQPPTVASANSIPAVQSPASSQEERQKTLDAFKPAADAWRSAGSRVELPLEADRHRILAENAFNEKNIDSALKHFKAALEIYPTWPQGQFNLAVLCGEIKDYECAYVHMKEYMLLAPDASDARTAYEKTVIWEDKLENPGRAGPSTNAPAPIVVPTGGCQEATLTGILSRRKGEASASRFGVGRVGAEEQMVLVLPDNQEIVLKKKTSGEKVVHKRGGAIHEGRATVTGTLCGSTMEYEEIKYEPRA